MNESISVAAQIARPPVSIATYAAIVATLLIMVLSAVTFAASSGEESARASYDPTVSLVGFVDAE
ncbi:MAG: hypothetical protein HOC77_01320 [Chloroflexi bacterium]|nr:hypothetical protein [Chloroflexota bacterium]MBT4072858.1 hypothetical protein [Chloroflexota bacterium]MBT4513717.1 hypothetical protein [Chloroflexota bacterium]MBT5320287.1 hypothetical protein [Chloroflexota bacterium]MBT6682057.1 hypothetical protein [Chloroflexota bacterium]